MNEFEKRVKPTSREGFSGLRNGRLADFTSRIRKHYSKIILMNLAILIAACSPNSTDRTHTSGGWSIATEGGDGQIGPDATPTLSPMASLRTEAPIKVKDFRETTTNLPLQAGIEENARRQVLRGHGSEVVGQEGYRGEIDTYRSFSVVAVIPNGEIFAFIGPSGSGAWAIRELTNNPQLLEQLPASQQSVRQLIQQGIPGTNIYYGHSEDMAKYIDKFGGPLKVEMKNNGLEIIILSPNGEVTRFTRKSSVDGHSDNVWIKTSGEGARMQAPKFGGVVKGRKPRPDSRFT